MNKTNIDWADYSWNPIKGLCPVGCYYCYARKMYNSKFYSKPPFNDPKIRWRFHESLNMKGKSRPKDGSKIFVCSTIEIFHPEIPKKWRDLIFQAIYSNPQHTFQILTKMPENIDREMPENVHLGVSCDGGKDDFRRLAQLGTIKAKIRFVSYEPLLGRSITGVPHLDWGIIGRLTGHGKKYDPKREWIIELMEGMTANNTAVFLKDNLIPIMGKEIVEKFREFPRE